MPRRPTGTIVEHTGKDGGMYRALRFTAYGKREYIALGAVSREHAERELRGVLADVERGTWHAHEAPPAPEPIAPEMTFHQFAELWWVERERELRPATRADYRWRLENHLLPFFGKHLLRQITIAEVDRYKATKLRDGDLGPRSINMTLTLLGAILEVAQERELIDRNTAKGKRRRVRETKPRRSYLDTAQQITALLDAAAAMDAASRADRRHVHRRAMLAVMVFGGLRIGELLELRWCDVELAAGRLRVGEAKTDAGRRDVTLRPVLRDVLGSLKASAADTRAKEVPRVPHSDREGEERKPRPQPHPGARREEGERALGRGRWPAAARGPDAALAAPHVGVAAVRAGRESGRGDGGARAHRPGARATDLHPGDAP